MMVNINIEVKEENMINFWNSGGDATELLQQADGWSTSGSGQIQIIWKEEFKLNPDGI